jgi:RNA polymerase sigma-70 factor (ECF subfamily)
MIEVEKLKKAQSAELKSIEEICLSTWEPLYRFIYYKVQNREEAEDITQETYVKALQYLQKNNQKLEHDIGFLKTVSLNLLRDKWRKNKRQGPGVNLEAIRQEEIASGDPAEAGMQRTVIESALKRLSEEQRKVIELRIIKGYSVAETAKIMQKKEAAVRVMQYRSLQILAKILKDSTWEV